jgi:dTDP-4-dehydrorhamnose reductase
MKFLRSDYRSIEAYMKILIIGAKGQLGVDLMAACRNIGLDADGVDLPECDITAMESLRRTMTPHAGYTVVINAAAYTDVDGAETDADTAFAVNSHGVGHLASLCAGSGTPLIHVSTDYVFDGWQVRPYRPSDPTSPQGVYGKSKAAGEAVLRDGLDQHVIVRTSWLYGVHGQNFVKTMLHYGRQRDRLEVVDDQIGSPTYTRDLAAALLQIARHLATNAAGWGTYHYCNEGAVTWCAFARKIFALAGNYDQFNVREIVPILSHQYPTPTPRPHYSVFDCSSLEETFGIARRRWDAALGEMLAELYSV